MDPKDYQLVVIFGFVICIILVKTIARFRIEKLWQETARLAIEKGQPPPGRMRPPGYSARRAFNKNIQGGLILIAVGAAMMLVMSEHFRSWGVLPAFIGVALLISGFFTRGSDGSGPPDLNSSDRLP